MKSFTLLTLLTTTLLLSSPPQTNAQLPAEPEADASWLTNVKPLLLEQAPILLQTIENSFTIENTGRATSLNDSFGEFSGQIVGPYIFPIKPKNTDTQAELIVRFQILFFDNELQPLPESDAARATSMHQSFIEFAIRPIQRMDDPLEVDEP